MFTEAKPGDQCEVFTDPLTRLDSEGRATLVSHLKSDRFDECMGGFKQSEDWLVRFHSDGNTEIVRRTIVFEY